MWTKKVLFYMETNQWKCNEDELVPRLKCNSGTFKDMLQVFLNVYLKLQIEEKLEVTK